MLVTFFDSFRYVGHLFPISIFRIFIGYLFLNMGMDHFQSDFLHLSQLSFMIQQYLPTSQAPGWLQAILGDFVVTHWQIFSYLVISFEVIIGVSFILGFLVRPISLLALLLCYCFIYITDASTAELYKVFMFSFFTLAWVGAGRCLGMDYYFFKRHRGIWW